MARSSFPILIREGSVTVRIYRLERKAERGRATRTVYQVSWFVAGARRLKQCATLDAARAEAKLKAEALAAGRSEAAVGVTLADVGTLNEIRRLAGRTPPLTAIEEWARARELCGDDLLVAAKAWANSKRAQKAVTVAEAVEAFLRDKDRTGVDTTNSYRKVLPRLVERLGAMPLPSVTAGTLTNTIHELFAQGESAVAHPGTFNTVRKRVVAVWNWARKQGYLADTATTEADKLEPMIEVSQRIGILTLQDYARTLELIRAKHSEFLAVAVLAGFAGLRRAELHAQTWDDVDLKRGILRVTAAKKNTASYRLVHLSPACVEWLLAAPKSKQKEGDPHLVTPAWGLDRVRAFAREAGIPTPENGYRHSYISYRCADSGNVAETAHEAGNSPAVVFKHYRELVAKEDGAAWFSLTLARAAQMVKDAESVASVSSGLSPSSSPWFLQTV